MANTPAVSIVIATRDRVSALARLLPVIKAQHLTDFECLIADDGSSPETLRDYHGLWQRLDARFILLAGTSRSPKGPSHTRNKGIRAARAPLIAFCDDDDRWVRDDHLAFAVDAMTRHKADLFFANMQTSRDGRVLGNDFYKRVRHHLTANALPGTESLYDVPLRERARAMQHIFLHCNSLVASRALLHDAGLYWEKLFMAEDRDFALRLLDRANRVLYRDVVTADYDRSAPAGLCRSHTEDEIRQFIILAMLHAETVLREKPMRDVARGYRAWMLVELAAAAAKQGRKRQARELARQSLTLRPTKAALQILFHAPGGTSRPLQPLKSSAN